MRTTQLKKEARKEREKQEFGFLLLVGWSSSISEVWFTGLGREEGEQGAPDGRMVWLLKGGTLWEDTQAKKSFAMIHSMKSLDSACLKETSVKT